MAAEFTALHVDPVVFSKAEVDKLNRGLPKHLQYVGANRPNNTATKRGAFLA